MRWLKLTGFLSLFVGLSAAGTAWAVRTTTVDASQLSAIGDLSWTWGVLLAGLVLGVFAADVLRYLALARALKIKLRPLVALDAVIASDFFSWLTPGASLGAPAAIYMLGRGGVEWGAASALSFLKSMIGVALLVVMTWLTLGLGLGPSLPVAATGVLIWGTGVVSLILATLFAAALAPGWSVARLLALRARLAFLGEGLLGRGRDGFIRVMGSAVERIGEIKRVGPIGWLSVLGANALFFGCFIGITAAVTIALGGAPVGALGASTVYLGFLYVAPTPGGSGLAEAGALGFFGHLVSAGAAFTVMMLSRALTLYVQIGVGFVYLLVRGGLREVLEGEKHAQP